MPLFENPWSRWLDDCTPWYPDGLPPTLTRAVEACGPGGILDLQQPIHNLEFLLEAATRLCRVHERRGTWIFHTLDNHVLFSVERLKEALYRLLDHYQLPIPYGIWQSSLPAMLLHDLGHAGASLRADAEKHDLYLPDLGHNISNEWASAVGADRFLANYGVHPYVRLAVCSFILATTVGGDTMRGVAHNVPNVQPTGSMNLLIRACDITPGGEYDFRWVARIHVSLHLKEVMIDGPPATWQELLERFIGFWSGHALECFTQLDDSLDISLTRELGWRATVDHILLAAEALKRGHAPHERSIFAELLQSVQAPFD